MRKSKKVKKRLFFGHFWANFGYVSHIQAIQFRCLCTRRGPFGCRMTVQNFVKIVWTVFEKFEIFMKRSGEKKQKKQHDCISSRKFFPTPKNVCSKYIKKMLLERKGMRLLKSNLALLRAASQQLNCTVLKPPDLQYAKRRRTMKADLLRQLLLFRFHRLNIYDGFKSCQL